VGQPPAAAYRLGSAKISGCMEPLLLRTPRLELRAATCELAAADLNDRSEFSRLLAAEVPPDWPAPLNDDNSKTFTLRYLTENPDAVGWAAWYFLSPGESDTKAWAVGIGGFTGKPNQQAEVEVGYSMMPGWQGSGLATEAVAALVDWAFSHVDVRLVTAQTLPALGASIRVLEKNGFVLLGEGSEEGVVRYGRGRE
jgi:[ribosomal protein S5]-alanine N-acetyltransferase